MESSLQEFLNEDQQKQLSETIRRILGKLGDLPVNVALIYKECYSACIDFMKEIDPEGILLLHKLTIINENSLYNQFQVIGATIILIVTKNAQVYEKERSLKFLTQQVSKEVNKKCQSQQFSLRIELNNSSNNGCNLWECMHEELIQIAMGILGFMHKHYGMNASEDRKMIEIQVFLQIFRQKFAGREKLSKIYMLSQRIEEKMKQSKNQSILLGEVQKDQWDQILRQIDDIQKKQEDEASMARLHQQEEDFNNEHKPLEKKQNIFAALKEKTQKAFQNVKAMITKDSPYEQKQITDIEIQESLQTFIENLESFRVMSEAQRKAVEEISRFSLKHIEEELQEEFDQRELSIIRYGIKNPIKKWDEYQKQIGKESQLCNTSTCILLNFSDQLEVATSKLKPRMNGHLNEMASYLLSAYFYRYLQSDYSVFAKRYLSKVLRVIEKQMNRNNEYLRGALHFLQLSSINPTKVANFLHKQRPLRSSSFELSNKSVIYQENNQFLPSEKIKQETDQLLKDIRSEKCFKEVTPSMEIIRLNSCPQSKTVTICVSGFLSQDSSKDLQWMGLIRALEETQLYSIGWESSTLKQSGAYLAKLATDLVLNPVNLTGPVGIIGNVMNIGAKVIHQYKSNPFASAHNRAAVVGLYLAQVLIKVFPDRFINLVGFSLGTQVIFCCLAHLANEGKLSLISKVVVLGGAAGQQMIKQILEKSPVSIELINLWSSKDYAIRFIYRLCRLGLMPIGASNLRPISGHEIFNIDSSKFVGSHMEFRTNLYGIGLLTGLVHD